MFRIAYPFKKEIIACGGEEKANFCITKKNCGYVINDLGKFNEQSVFEIYQSELERLKTELKIKPKIITHDLDPRYSSTKYAQDLNQRCKGSKCLAVQHHQAHLASCIGENNLTEKVLGVVFDAGAMGEDNEIWGGEFFVGDVHELTRVAHLKYTPLPEGQNHEGSAGLWQKTASFLFQAFGREFMNLEIDFLRLHQQDWEQTFIPQIAQFTPNSSVANLFDAVSALVGLRTKTEYEGHGVVDLERIVNRSTHVAGRHYEFELKPENGTILICPEKILEGIVEDLKKNISKSIISTVFHNTMIEMVRMLCQKLAQKFKVSQVILTGSVFQNKMLFNQLKVLLPQQGLNIITHKHFSCNDNNLSFGQAVLADGRCLNG